MNKLLRYSFVALMAMFMGNAFGQEVVFDFTDEANPWGFPTEQLKETGTFTKDGKSIVITTTNYTRWFSDSKALLIGKEGATLTLPAFDFDVERIEVVGHEGASGKVTHNIFVGDEAVSTEVTGAKGTSTFNIADGKQAAGTIYVLKVTNANNDQICKINIWKKGSVSGGGEEEIHIANTAETAYTVAKAIELIDAGKALSEEVYVKGKISKLDGLSSGSYTYWISDDGTTESSQFECFKGKGLEGADFASAADLKKGATVIVKGKLKKYNSIYEFDAGNVLVSYDASTAVEENHIANTQETAYTVAKAIELIDAGQSLQEIVFVKGIVSQVDKYDDRYSSITYWISDDGTTTNQFECYSGKGIGGAAFTSKDDIKVGATVIVKGNMKKFNTTYEFDKNNELVVYDESTAGISTIKAEEANAPVYNLAGQRVEKATKGVFIQNGKKFVVK